VRECITSTFVSSVGAYIDRFETSLAAYTAALHAIVVVNGTAALQVVLNLAGVKRSDEVILPAPTFVATANAVQYLNAILHFADSEKTTLGLDPDALCDLVEGHC
jgi:perosamine synthetase